MIMIFDILIPLFVVGLAELGDKTQLCVLLLSSKISGRLQIFAGVMLAFLVTDGVAILAGSWVTGIIPMYIIRGFSGAIFVVFGILILREKMLAGECRAYSKNAFISAFALVFLSEWGDKTQIASGLLATQYNALFVLAGVLVALGIVSLAAIFLGKIVSERIDKRLVNRIAGAVFIIIGVSFFFI